MWLTLTLACVMSYPFFSVRVDSECVSVFVYSSRETLRSAVKRDHEGRHGVFIALSKGSQLVHKIGDGRHKRQ